MIRLRVLPQILPIDGKQIELQVTATHIQWRYTGDAGWTDLIALSELVGPEGPAIEMRSDGTNIQYRQIGSGEGGWVNVIPLVDITGPPSLVPGPVGPAGPSGNGYTKLAETARTAGFSILSTEAGNLQVFSPPSPAVVVLPPVAGTISEIYRFLNLGPSTLTIDPFSAEVIDGASSLAVPVGGAVDVWPNEAKTSWRAFVYQPDGSLLRSSSNLSDLPDKVAARTNLKQSWEEIYKGQVSAVGSFSLNNLSAYRRLRVEAFIRPAANGSIKLRFSSNNGSSFLAGASDYRYGHLYAIIGTVNHNDQANADGIVASITGSVGFSGQGGVKMTFEIERFNEASAWAWVDGQATAYTSTNNLSIGSFHGTSQVAAAFDAFQLIASSGNIAYGDFLVEGVRG